MGIFDRKKSKEDELPPLWSPGDLDDLKQVDYNSVIDYLQGLSDKDYEAVIKVSEIYRHANEKAHAALGLPVEPTTFIHPPLPPANAAAAATGSFLEDDEDTGAGSFLDDHDTPASKSQSKTAKKVTRARIKTK